MTRGTKSRVTGLTAALIMLIAAAAAPVASATPAGDAYVLDLPGSGTGPINAGGGPEVAAPLASPSGIVGERSVPESVLSAGLTSLRRPGGLAVLLAVGGALGLAMRSRPADRSRGGLRW